MGRWRPLQPPSPCRMWREYLTAPGRESYTSMRPIASLSQKQEGNIIQNANNSLCRYYQPNAPINQDTCFPDPSASADNEEPVRDINIQSSVTSSKISSPDTALTAFCQLTTWRTGMQRAMIRYRSLSNATTLRYLLS
jgi:hypothetical protein